MSYYTKQVMKLKNVDFNTQKCTINGLITLDIHKNSKVKIGDYFVANSGLNSGIYYGSNCKITVNENAELSIGEHSGMTNTSIQCHKKIIIGKHVNIGAGCLIMDSNFHSTNWKDRLNRKADTANKKNAPIKIGDVVFIGANSIICKGVTIGNHSIIAAGSVVVCSIPENEVWGGNPAKFLKAIQSE